MSRELISRKGPEFNFVIPEHRRDFEGKVIATYEKVLTTKGIEPYHLPHVVTNLFNYIALADPIHYVAARLSYEQHDESFHDNHLKHLSYDEQFQVAIDYMKSFEDDRDPRERDFYDDLFYEDITAVLNFHHMSFMDIGHLDETLKHWKRGDFYKNLPWLRQVW